ncbi:MAG: D-amino-acid transaminase [Filomicrobium sp.]
MTRFVYVNGTYHRYREAGVHVEDRGFQFADSVYEVIEIASSALVDSERHLARLERSLAELEIPPPMARGPLLHVIGETVRRNRVREGMVYLQVSRGVGVRDFLFTGKPLQPTLVCLARHVGKAARDAAGVKGMRVVSVPDIRWGRCDIKTVMLLPAVLAKHEALKSGAAEAWFVDSEGYVTEGGSTNAWIVNAEGELQTRKLSNALLPGVTRRTLFDVADELGLPVKEAAFSIEAAQGAREAFVTSASNTVMPVINIDGVDIGNGQPGPISVKLRHAFHGIAEHMALGTGGISSTS